MKFIKKVPMAISGLSLSLAVLGNLLLPYGAGIRYACGILSGAILLLFVLKLAFDGASVKEELQNPVVFSILPTATMALMLLCAYLKPFFGAAVYLWYAALIAQIAIMLLFARRFLLGFKLQTVFPSWFITGVGIVVASVTSPAMNAKPLGQAICYLGLALYLILLPAVIYRMVKAKPLPEPARPTIAIFTAPVSLCLAGYLSAAEQPNLILVYAMLAVVFISYLYVTVNMVSLLRLKFYPTYAAFTFPYAISAVALKAANAFLVNNGQGSFLFAVQIAQWLAVLIVVYVLVRYVIFFVSGLAKKQEIAG